ncbi:MAG: O-antigen ligase family protein [Kofleriaceae bacterium]|nr:O-antigen ligase family protein [Kofleriaceae bacterium]
MGRHGRDLAALAGLALAVAIAIFAVGGAHRWTVAAVAAVAGAAAAVTLPSRRVFARRNPLLVLLALGAGLCVLQLVPLPAGLVDGLTGESSALIADSHHLAGADAGWRPIAVDPAATTRGLATALALLAAAFVAARLAASDRGRAALVRVVAGLIALAALTGVVHEVVGAGSLYGVYRPDQATPTVMAPLLNGNSYAGLLAVGAILALGLGLEARTRIDHRLAWISASLLCVGVLVLTGSRGGAAALVVALVVFLGVLLAQRRVDEDRASRRPGARWLTHLPAVVIIGCAFALVVHWSGGGLGRQLAHTSLEYEVARPVGKVAIWRAAAAQIGESPWLGIGRGGFETASTRLYPGSSHGVASHVENEYVQTVVDFGIPGAIALTVVIGWCVLVGLRRWRDGPLAAAALAALAGIGLAAMADFGLELLGLGLPVVIVASTLCYGPLREAAATTGWLARARRGVVVAGAALAALLCVTPLTRDVAADRAALGPADRPQLAPALAALRRHPLDFVAAGRAADAAARAGRPEAVRLLNHALALHPTHPGLHQLAGRVLLRAGRGEQAALEFRLAAEHARDPSAAIREAVRVLPTVELAARALPVRYADPRRIGRVLAELGRDDLAVMYYRAAVRARPTEPQLGQLLYQLALQRGDLEVAEEAARARVRARPELEAKLALAQVLYRRGRHAEVGPLAEGVDLGTEAGRALSLLACDALVASRDLARATTCLGVLATAWPTGVDAEPVRVRQQRVAGMGAGPSPL